MSRVLGVDLGGTWLRACLLDSARRTPRLFRRRATAPLEAHRVLRGLRLGKLDKLVIGSTGVWSSAQRRALARSLSGLAEEIHAASDVELAQRAAFAGAPGVLVIAGTGSIALAVDARGRVRRRGGWGPLLGDEGSAFWIGKTALGDPRLRDLFRDVDPLKLAAAKRPQKEVAALAVRVLKAAPQRPAAAALRRAAAGWIARLAEEAAAGMLFPNKKTPLSWHGGLFEDPSFLKDFLRALSPRFAPEPPALSAAAAAALLY